RGGARVPVGRDLAARVGRTRRAERAAPHDRALERRGRAGGGRHRHARAPPGRPPAAAAPAQRSDRSDGVNLRPATVPSTGVASGLPRHARLALLAGGLLAAATLAAVVSGVVRLPDVE